MSLVCNRCPPRLPNILPTINRRPRPFRRLHFLPFPSLRIDLQMYGDPQAHRSALGQSFELSRAESIVTSLCRRAT